MIEGAAAQSEQCESCPTAARLRKMERELSETRARLTQYEFLVGSVAEMAAKIRAS
jgi:hypothetical protein